MNIHVLPLRFTSRPSILSLPQFGMRIRTERPSLSWLFSIIAPNCASFTFVSPQPQTVCWWLSSTRGLASIPQWIAPSLAHLWAIAFHNFTWRNRSLLSYYSTITTSSFHPNIGAYKTTNVSSHPVIQHNTHHLVENETKFIFLVAPIPTLLVRWPSCLIWAESTTSMIDIFRPKQKTNPTINMSTKPRAMNPGLEHSRWNSELFTRRGHSRSLIT